MRFRILFLPLLLSILLFALGCTSTEQVFVARTDVPEDPTLAVIPANNQLYQHHFANEVEEKVIEAGLRVIRRPNVTTKKVTQEAEMAQIAADNQAAQKTAEITQTYSGFGESDADYVVSTYALSEEVRIMEQATGRVLATFDLVREQGVNETSFNEPEPPLREALREIGLPVVEKEEE
jgi:hypothetical protein